MTSAQRYWLVGTAILFAVILAVYHLEWSSHWRTYGYKWDAGVQLAVPFWLEYLDESATEVHGLYVRDGGSLIVGGVVPLLLIAAAGFVLLGAPKTRLPNKKAH